MKASIRGLILAGFVAAFVVSFQNCGQNQFQAVSDGPASKASGPATGGLVPIDNTGEADGSLGQPVIVDSTPAPTPGSSPLPEPTPAVQPTPAATPHGQAGEHESGDDLNLCVIEGPGRSMRVGYSDEKLDGTRGAPHDVCMSAHACIDIVGQVFKVKMLFPQPCKGLLHNQAVHLDDGQIEKLVEEMKK